MKIVCNLSGITNYSRPVQGIKDISNSGFQYVFLDLKDVYNHSFKGEIKDFSDGCKMLINKCKEANIHIYGFRTPSLTCDNKGVAFNELQEKLAEESIKLCSEADCKYLLVPPISSQSSPNDEWEVNREYYSRLGKVAQKYHVTILLENQYKRYNGRMIRGICSDGREAAEWVDRLNKIVGGEGFAICMNVGTCNLYGQNMQDYAQALGERIKAVVLRDGYGHDEVSSLPFTAVKDRQSQTDWLSLIRGLREISFDGGLILDFEDTAAAFSPLLRPQLLSLAKAIAEYFRWQIKIEDQLKKYKSIVLFGAGNMCRNYMKCYGEKYPPIFTCDNNQKLWETNFCGLEVKSPEALKNISPDWGIFICNIYYREIESQLRDMGIKNNIEFFNDEYMASYYFDRLERK
ncbi:MAG TPA: hypothetical protein DGK91_03390 [Clostridium sp.]|nr:hypothetical protein [Clostridium sp.]